MVRNMAFGHRLASAWTRQKQRNQWDAWVKCGRSTRISCPGMMSSPRFHLSTLVKSDDVNEQLREILRSPDASLAVPSRRIDIQSLVKDTYKGVTSEELLIKLLDRLAKEMHLSSDGSTVFSSQDFYSLLKAAIYQWRNTYIETLEKSSLPLQPSQVVRKLRAWSRHYGVHADTSIYTMILEAAASNAKDDNEGVDFADSLLEWMLDEARNQQNFALQPTTVSVGVVMNAWVGSGRKEAPERIEAWLSRLHSLTDEGWPNLQPNVVLYNILLNSLAQDKNPARVEQVLQSMLQGRYGVSPDHISFSTVLSAYSKQETPDAIAKAEILLHQMLELYQSGMESVKPNVVSFSTVMNGFATLGEPESAERLFRELESLYHETGDPDFEPDIAAYNIVLLAWSKADQPDRASIMLQDIMERSSLVKPNSQSFHAVLSGWAKTGQPEKAEECLHQMHEYYTMGGHDSPPTVMTYNIVLDAWAKSRRRDAWERAQSILQHMQVLYQGGDQGVKPNIRTWNTVLNCFRYCGQGDFHHAFRLLDDFLAAVDAGLVDGSPNVITWNTLLAACVRNTKDDYRVNQIWTMMRKRGCKPDIITYNTIFSCYSQYSGRKNESQRSMEMYLDSLRKDKDLVPTASTYLALINALIAFGMIENAEGVLKEIITASNVNQALDPEREPFHQVLNAWSDAGEPRRVESLVLLMEELKDRARLTNIKPTSETYNILLRAWARSKERQAGERTDLILREMASRGVSVTLHSYNFALTAWANSGDPTALTKIESIILEMILHQKPELMPDISSYKTWLKAILAGDETGRARRIKELQRTMKIHNFEPNDFLQETVQKYIRSQR